MKEYIRKYSQSQKKYQQGEFDSEKCKQKMGQVRVNDATEQVQYEVATGKTGQREGSLVQRLIVGKKPQNKNFGG